MTRGFFPMRQARNQSNNKQSQEGKEIIKNVIIMYFHLRDIYKKVVYNFDMSAIYKKKSKTSLEIG